MCGRYTLKTPPDQWGQLLLPLIDAQALQPSWKPRYNIAPTQQILAIASMPEGQLIVDYFRWGLVPAWASDLAIGNRMINARSETLSEKRSFAGPLSKRRCMILADGYYEWQKLPGGAKQPCWIAPANGGVIQLAGLWETNKKATGQEIQSCTIITTAANSALASVHDRMPVMLTGDAARNWMSPDCDSKEAQSLLGAAEDDFFTIHKVSNYVNNARHEGPQCLEGVHTDAADAQAE